MTLATLPATWGALRDALADDLAELAAIRRYDIAAPLAGLREALALIPDRLTILQIYSALFLVPPRKASINTGIYLDGALNGGSVIAMEAAYKAARLVRAEDFTARRGHGPVQKSAALPPSPYSEV